MRSLPGPRSDAIRLGSLASHESLRYCGEKLPRRYGSGEGAHPPGPPSPLRRGFMSLPLIPAARIRVGSADLGVEGLCQLPLIRTSRTRSPLLIGSHGSRSWVGWGALPVDPDLLGVVEAANADLVVGPRLRRRVRLSVVYGESPHPSQRLNGIRVRFLPTCRAV